MARERTNTLDKLPLIQPGTRDFMVCGEIRIIKVGANKDKSMYIVPLQYVGGIGEQSFLSNQMGPILKILGAKEIQTGVYDWDTQEFEGKTFNATVSHRVDDKGISRSGMKDFKPAEAIGF